MARAQEFTTFKDGQTAMAVHVVQGERERITDCRSLARFELRGIPPMAAGAARIRVTFNVDADGLLSVAAREQTTGVEAAVEVKPSYGLSDEEVARMLQDSFTHAADDATARALAEAQVEAEQLLALTRAALAADGDLLSADERRVVEACLSSLDRARVEATAVALRAEIERANHATENFAQRRMDRGVTQALAGRRVDSLA